MRQLSTDELKAIVERDQPGYRLASARPSRDAHSGSARSSVADADLRAESATHERNIPRLVPRVKNASTNVPRSPLRFLASEDYGATDSLAESVDNAQESVVDSVHEGIDRSPLRASGSDDDAEDAIVVIESKEAIGSLDLLAHEVKAAVVSGKDRKITSVQG